MKARVSLKTSKLEQGQEDEEKLLGEEATEQLDETVAVEEKFVYPDKVLTRQEISTRLSHLGKVAGGDGYAYLNATCTGMKLTDISELKHFQHIQFVNVSDNHLELQALQALAELPFLISIQADNNGLNSAALKLMKYLQVIIMNHNEITSVEDVYQPELCTLEVGYNKITKVIFAKTMLEMKCLDFRYNLIEDILDLHFPKLDSLFLAGNKIKSLIGLEKLVNLRVLHLRYNPLRLLDGFNECHKKLEYVNLRNCKVATLRQVKKLKVLTGLDTLVMKGCPYMGGTGEETGEMDDEEEDSEIRMEVLAALPRLKRLNKGIVTSEEMSQAKELLTQWLEEGDKDEEEIEDEQHEEDSNLD